MDLAIVVLIAFGLGAAAGAVAVHYIHNIASAATPATSSAIQALLDAHAKIASLEATIASVVPKTT